jgi:hypothetical protein
LKLQGVLQGQLVSILIDSGSSSAFVSDSLLSSLDGIAAMTNPVKVWWLMVK